MNERLIALRKHLGLTQVKFAEKINLSQAQLGRIETGSRTLTDRSVSDICREFSVNETWLRTGEGEMFTQPKTFSLDEFARARGANDFEIEIVKAYFDLPQDIRTTVIDHFQEYLSKEKASPARVEQETPPEDVEAWAASEAEAYRLELLAEKEAETSSVSGFIREKNA